MKILLGDEERAALYGLPYIAICLYLMAMRPRVDYATGMLGVKPRISWHALTEWLYIEPRQGMRGGSPSRWAVMRACEHLQRAGLIRTCTSECNSQLVFELLMINKRQHVQIKPARGPHTKSAHPSDPVLRGETQLTDTKSARGKKAKAAIHPGTVRTNTQYHHLNVNYTGLQWPEKLTPIENRAILALLEKSKINGTAQLVLDELAGAIQTKGVYNRVGYARTLIERAVRGQFLPEKAHLASAARDRRAALESSSPPSPAQPPAQRSGEKARAALSEMKTIIKGARH